jgi:hypothetical protein
MFYKIKVLIVATMIYLFNTDTSAEGAVQQAKCVVREVDKQCKK